jgi:hypothetical protein
MMKDEEKQKVPIYGDVEIDEDEEAVLRLHPKFAMYSRMEMKIIDEEAEIACTKIRWNRREKEG